MGEGGVNVVRRVQRVGGSGDRGGVHAVRTCQYTGPAVHPVDAVETPAMPGSNSPIDLCSSSDEAPVARSAAAAPVPPRPPPKPTSAPSSTTAQLDDAILKFVQAHPGHKQSEVAECLVGSINSSLRDELTYPSSASASDLSLGIVLDDRICDLLDTFGLQHLEEGLDLAQHGERAFNP